MFSACVIFTLRIFTNIFAEEFTMSVYLIDFENVRSDGLAGIENLKKGDEVFIFYSEHAATLTIAMHKRILGCPAKIYYVEAMTGTKNALDFQLVSYLGYMIREKPEVDYFIVSKDKGFEVVAQFWETKGVRVFTEAALDGCAEDAESESIRKFLEENLSDKSEREFVGKCIKELATKSGINNRIVKKYGTTRAGEIYKLIKPLIKDKKG